MTRTKWIWAVLIAIFGVFFSWYTSFGGPLTDEEIEHYKELFARREPTPSPQRLADADEGVHVASTPHRLYQDPHETNITH
jgi:hypothetical protein